MNASAKTPELPAGLLEVMRAVYVGDAPVAAWAGRLGDGTLLKWLDNPAVQMGCARPVRIAGRSTLINPLTGQVVASFDTADLPDGVLYKPCGSRLASVCPACAHVYRYDTYHLIAAGLRGGKGVPESVACHPAVFATFTAPSFGLVHTGGDNAAGARWCRPRRDFPVCAHGRKRSCRSQHGDGDRAVGTPFCLDCYDHDHQVVWNLFAPALFARTMDRLHRRVARLGRVHDVQVKLRYAKVAEFQVRGALHFHALFRLDGYDPARPDEVLPPPCGITAADIVALIRSAVADTALLTPPHSDNPQGWPIAWGEQLDLRVVRDGLGEEQLTDRHVAGYLAKYATKSTETLGAAIPPLSEATAGLYGNHATHLGRLVAAAWRLGRPGCGEEYARLRAKAHMLGFTGHFSSKSHRYSTTLGALRAARRPTEPAGVKVIPIERYDELVADQGRDHDEAADEVVLLLDRHFTYAGTGWKTTSDAALAAAAADLARSRRDAA